MSETAPKSEPGKRRLPEHGEASTLAARLKQDIHDASGVETVGRGCGAAALSPRSPPPHVPWTMAVKSNEWRSTAVRSDSAAPAQAR